MPSRNHHTSTISFTTLLVSLQLLLRINNLSSSIFTFSTTINMLRRSHTCLLIGGMGSHFRHPHQKQRSYRDAGAYNKREYGSIDFDQSHVRGFGSSKQIKSEKSIRRERFREDTSREILSKLDSDNNRENRHENRTRDALRTLQRSDDLRNFGNPRNAKEAQFIEDEFGRSLQLRDKSQQQQQRGKNSDNNNNNDIDNRNYDAKNRKQFVDRHSNLPRGLGVIKGPESTLRRERNVDLNTNQDAPLPYTKKLHNWQTSKELSTLERAMKVVSNSSVPSSKEYSTALRKLGKEEVVDGEVSQLHEKLIDDHGLYPTQRLDAYMLQDESMFPTWVNQLAPHLRDRVRYGGIGLTDDDEILRQNLARLPPEERQDEWSRLKTAREYKHGTIERKVSPAEVRQLRLGIRRHHALHKKRLRQAIDLKQLALRRPEKHDVWPSRDIDYSARLATVAKFVEAGVETKGQWPLDVKQLANATKRKHLNMEAHEAFVNAGVALSSAMPDSDALSLGPGSAQMMKRLEDKQREVKRISKKKYAHRLVAISQGYQDEHGRKFHQLASEKKRVRKGAYKSEDEMRMEKELVPFVSADDSYNNVRMKRAGGVTGVGLNNAQWDGYYPYAEEKRKHGIPGRDMSF